MYSGRRSMEMGHGCFNIKYKCCHLILSLSLFFFLMCFLSPSTQCTSVLPSLGNSLSVLCWQQAAWVTWMKVLGAKFFQMAYNKSWPLYFGSIFFHIQSQVYRCYQSMCLLKISWCSLNLRVFFSQYCLKFLFKTTKSRVIYFLNLVGWLYIFKICFFKSFQKA